MYSSPDNRFIWYLSIIGFFAIFSTTISKNPVLPLYAGAMGADDLIIGLISAVSPLAGVLFSFPVGVLADHIGRRKILLLSGLVFLIAPLLYLLVPAPLWLIPVRFFHGMATAILGPVISTIIVERFSRTKGERLGQYSSATLIGRTIAPLIGGGILSLALVTGHPFLQYQAVYITAALAALPVFLLILMYREENNRQSTIHVSAFWESLHSFLSSPGLRATAGVDMGIYFVFGTFETFIPVFLATLGIDPWLTGIIFSAQVLVIACTKPAFGWLADHIDERYQIITGLFLVFGSVIVIPVGTEFAIFLLISLVFGAGMSLTTIATSTYVANLSKHEEIGASMGALSSIMDIGHSMGPFISGSIISISGYALGFQFGSVLLLAIALAFVISDHTAKN